MRKHSRHSFYANNSSGRVIAFTANSCTRNPHIHIFFLFSLTIFLFFSFFFLYSKHQQPMSNRMRKRVWWGQSAEISTLLLIDGVCKVTLVISGLSATRRLRCPRHVQVNRSGEKLWHSAPRSPVSGASPSSWWGSLTGAQVNSKMPLAMKKCVSCP